MDDYTDMAKTKRKGTGNLPFPTILSKIIQERRLTLKEVAALAGVSISVIENWLSGSVPHDLAAVDRLAGKLGIPFKKLLLGLNETVDAPSSIGQLFTEQELFEGLVKLKITRLNPKNGQE